MSALHTQRTQFLGGTPVQQQRSPLPLPRQGARCFRPMAPRGAADCDSRPLTGRSRCDRSQVCGDLRRLDAERSAYRARGQETRGTRAAPERRLHATPQECEPFAERPTGRGSGWVQAQ